MSGGPSLKGKGGLVGFRRSLIINKKTNIIYNVVSTHIRAYIIYYISFFTIYIVSNHI